MHAQDDNTIKHLAMNNGQNIEGDVYISAMPGVHPTQVVTHITVTGLVSHVTGARGSLAAKQRCFQALVEPVAKRP